MITWERIQELDDRYREERRQENAMRYLNGTSQKDTEPLYIDEDEWEDDEEFDDLPDEEEDEDWDDDEWDDDEEED